MPPPLPPGVIRVLPIARWTVRLLATVAILQVLTVVLSWTVVDDAEAFLDGRLTEREFAGRYAGVLVASLLLAASGIALFVMVIVWMYRIATNADRLGRRGRWSPGWAIGGWFAPPFLFVIPFLHLRQLWQTTEPRADWTRAEAPPLITLWWVLYGLIPTLLIPFGVSVSFNVGDGGSAAESLRDDLTLQTLSSGLNVAAAIAFGVLVHRLSTRQAALTGEAR
jgi:hypothetical protein